MLCSCCFYKGGWLYGYITERGRAELFIRHVGLQLLYLVEASSGRTLEDGLSINESTG